MADDKLVLSTLAENDPLDHYTNIGNRLMVLHRRLNARDGIPTFAKNCEDIRAEIQRLEDVQKLHLPQSDEP
jgi:Mg2+ and Co2+ transporter CorA